jgi:hypothetical protein
MTIPEFTIDKNIKHFITDMEAYLSCFHINITENQKSYLILSAVKGDAKDILLSYTIEQLNTVDKIFRVLMNEFKKREQCVVNLHQFKQDLNEKVIIFASRIRRYVREMGVNDVKFDRVCIEYLKIGSLSHIQHRLQQKDPHTFERAVKIAIEAETEKAAKSKSKTAEPINQLATVDHETSLSSLFAIALVTDTTTAD